MKTCKTVNYKGKGEHSVRELELIIEQQSEELHLIKSGQKQLPIHEVMPSLPDGLDDDSNCDHNFKLGWIACWKALTGNDICE